MIAKLLVVEGSTTLREVTLRRPRTVAGRKKGCKLRIRSQLVSRIHCSFVREGDRLRIKDLGSSNGTFVNGIRITESLLNAGDIVQIGPIKFAVQFVESAEAARRAPNDEPAPSVKLPDGEVVVFESEDPADAEEVIEVDLLEELEDDVEFVTHGGSQDSHPPVNPAQNIFASDSEAVLDADQFIVHEDDLPKSDYKIADPSDGPNPRR
jgi:pSer/pThr/pTyr-binding forkhead associated (FHA) protein